MLPLCSEPELSELLARKEEEWRVLQAHRAQLQEAALQAAQNRLEETQGKLQRLQEDFVYNLQVLEERDRELERYDVEFTQARRREEAQQAEASELKIVVAKLKQELTREARRVGELQQQHQLMLQEHHLELERVHSDKNSELVHQREQNERLEWELERKLKELDGELALQRQELLLEFESKMQRREHEFQLRADDMNNVVLTHELKIKLLNKELQALRDAGARAAESLQKAEAKHMELERKLQEHARELQDLEAVKDIRIKGLEKKLHSAQLAKKKAEETFRRKHEELDRQAREKDTVLAAVKRAHAEELQTLDAKVLELQFRCETLEGQLRRAECTRAEDAKEKNALTDKFRDDAAALKAAWDAQITQMSKEAVSKDFQIHTLQEEEMKLKAQVARFQQDIDRYKQQLSLAVERGQSLEREQVQLGLDWQRRCDDIERDQIQKSETLIEGLTKARDQVAAKLQETEKALRQQETLLKAVSLERDQAMETLRTHGLLPGQEAQVPPQQHEREIRADSPSTEIQRLQEQNAGLRNAVSQMRREMEMLSSHLPPAQPEECSNADPDPKAGGDSTPPDAALADQTSTALALRKLGDRVHLLNLLVTQLKRKLRQKPWELVPVQHEVPSEVDQVHLEVLELQKQVAELRKHLKVTQPQGEPSSREQLQRQDPRHTKRRCVSEYAGKSQPHSAQVGSKINTPRGHEAEMASRPAQLSQKQHRIPTETWKPVHQKENRTPKLPQAQEVPEESDHRTHRSSSLASSSLQDTWRLLELGSSPSGVPSQDNSAAECPAPPGPSCFQKVNRSPVPIQKVNRSPVPIQKAFAVKGLKMEAQPKATHPRPIKSHPTKPTNCQQQRPPRIRNYNLKD
ncbi:coiled-coil domain-containing protein 57 isoform X2 [Mus caroli]|uniref:Coiled-coil domain-containing protein 57 isoform X2 n=1 Tax=Mus caroli TaxID=10089 RepID=A0A6P7RWF1_MUSCR|nr:coiled-coil domain-containing protein 57 isoform X2 [Mus caroli]